MKEVRKKMKEFYAEYDGTRFDIYDASPMFTDNGWVLEQGQRVALVCGDKSRKGTGSRNRKTQTPVCVRHVCGKV